MHTQHFEVLNLKDERHQAAVASFDEWSRESGTMLPITRARIKSFSLSIFGFDPDENIPLTHAAITTLEEGVATIGGYITRPSHRGHGLGRQSLRNLVTVAPVYLGDIHTFRANVNLAGLSQFAALGELAVGDRPTPADTGCNLVVEFSPTIGVLRIN